MGKSYAGIGSRETPQDILWTMEMIASHLAHDFILRSGGADGADSAFERGCNNSNGKKEIYLPWKGFNNRYGNDYHYDIPERAFEIASFFHPAWSYLKDPVKRLMARNSMQIFGKNLDDPVSFVVCWTKGGMRGGGTGQALRIAEHFKITIVDLAVTKWSDIYDTLIK